MEGLTNTGADFLCHALQIIPAKNEGPFKKAAKYSSAGFALKVRVAEDGTGRQAGCRFGYQELGLRELDGFDDFTNAAHPCIVAMQKKGHIGTKAQADR